MAGAIASFTLSLLDKVSGPAAGVVGQLSAVTRGLTGTALSAGEMRTAADQATAKAAALGQSATAAGNQARQMAEQARQAGVTARTLGEQARTAATEAKTLGAAAQAAAKDAEQMGTADSDAAKKALELANAAAQAEAKAKALGAAAKTAASDARSMSDAARSTSSGASQMASAAKGAEKEAAGLGQAATEAEGQAAGMGEALGGLAGGPIGAVTSALKVGAAAAIAFAAAIATVTVALAAMAIKAGEAKTALTSSFGAMLGGAEAGKAAYETVEKVAESLGMTKEALAPMAQQLVAAGVKADKLAASLKAVASANAIVAGGGDKLTSILSKMAEQGDNVGKLKFALTSLTGTGITEDDLMKALGMTPKTFALAKKNGTLTGKAISDALIKAAGSKGAGPLADQANKLSSIWDRFKESVMSLFEGVTSSSGYKAFVSGLKSMLNMFGAGTSTAKNLQTTVTNAFSALFSAAAKVLPYIKLALEKIVIWLLKTYIAVKTWWKEQNKSGEMAAKLKTLGQVFSFIGTMISGVASGFANIVKWVGTGISLFTTFVQKGVDIAKGLADGIKSGVGMVVDAIKGLGTSAMAALKSVLGIASPSKMFSQLGGFTAQGFSKGLAAGAKPVKAAAQAMGGAAMQGAAKAASGAPSGAPAAAKALAPAAATPAALAPSAAAIAAPPIAPSPATASSGKDTGKGGGKGNTTINVLSGAIVINGADGGGGQGGQQGGGGGKSSASDLTEIALTAMLERIRISQGIGA